MFRIDRRLTVFCFSMHFCDRQLADRPSTEPTLCQSDWLTADFDLHCAKLPSMHCEWMP